MRGLRGVLAAGVIGTGIAVAGAGGAAAHAEDGTVMRGLHNPRGLTFESSGHARRSALYVAEAGTGGTLRCVPLRGASACVGLTGAISRYRNGRQERIVEGLPSYTPFSGTAPGAIGPHDVSFRHGRGYAVIGLATPVALRPALGERFGWTVQFDARGRVDYRADVAAQEQATNPDGGPVESNPYGLLKGAGDRVVVDAAGNSLHVVRPWGAITTRAVFPSRPQGRSTDSVPTSIAISPRGAAYVGELTGAPFLPALSSIWRLRPWSATPGEVCSGFSYIIDLDFDRRGNLYVLEQSSGPNGPFTDAPGRLMRVGAGCETTIVREALPAPMAVAIGPDGDAYVSLNGTTGTDGEVRQIDLDDPSHGPTR